MILPILKLVFCAPKGCDDNLDQYLMVIREALSGHFDRAGILFSLYRQLF